MRKNTNSFSNGNRSVKQVLGAGSRVGMAALIAASAASPVMSAAAAFADEAPEADGTDASLTQAGWAPEQQQKADDKLASEENLAVKQAAWEQAAQGADDARDELEAAQGSVNEIQTAIDNAQSEADAVKMAALENTLATAQAALDAAEAAQSKSSAAVAAEKDVATALAAAQESAAAKQLAADQAADALAKARQAYETAGGGEELEASEAELAAAQDVKAKAEAELARAKQAQQNAEAALESARQAVQSDAGAVAAAQQQVEAAQAQLTSANAELAAANADLARVEAGGESEQVEAAKAKVTACEQAVAIAQSEADSAAPAVIAAQGVADASAQAQAEAEKALLVAKDVQASRLQSVTDANAQVTAAQAALDEAIRVGNLNVQALADANAELGKYTELAKRGSLGFFEEIGATTAVKWLTDPAGTSGLGEGCGTTIENLGDSKSATSLDNMKCALETMAKVNDLRRENGRSELRVYSAIMAASQINLNYSASHKPFYHAPSKYPYGENLAAGYKDPFVGWYDKEKAHYGKDMADGVLDGYDADGNKVGNCGHYFNILETGYAHYGCAFIASRWFHLQDFDSIEGFKRLVTDDEYVEGHEILGVGPNGEYYREDGKPWTCHWEVVTPDDYLREKYGDRSYSAEEYYALFMKYYNKVHGTLDPSYQQAVDDAKVALEAAQVKAIAANAASADRVAAETAAKRAVASAQAAVSADAQKKAAAQTALSNAQAQAGDAQV